jgi:hypothetical protein
VDKQLLTKPLLRKTKNTNMAGGKLLVGGMMFSLAQTMGWDCLIVGLLLLLGVFLELLLLLGVFDCWDIFS